MLFYTYRAKYDAIEVTAYTFLPPLCMDKKIPYKYSVQYSSRCYYYEYIHDLSVKDPCNRCLELSHQTIKETGNVYSLLLMRAKPDLLEII